MSEDYQAMMADQNRRAGFRDLAEPDFIEMYESVRRFSMTSVECLFDLYKSVRFIAEAGVPGALVECGVWRGGSMMLIAYALNYFNVQPVAALPGVRELHIGHSIVARSVFVGLREAVSQMKALLREAATPSH